jgi:transposase
MSVNSDNIFIEMCRKRKRNEEFNEIAKALIIREVETGRSYRAVAADAGTSPSTVYQIVQRWKTQRTLTQKPRSGRPKKLTVRQIRLMLITLKRDRRITYEGLVNYLGGRISRSTLRRAIRLHYGRKWKAMQRIPLSKETARQRLQWCLGWRDDIDELITVWLFKDTPIVST